MKCDVRYSRIVFTCVILACFVRVSMSNSMPAEFEFNKFFGLNVSARAIRYSYHNNSSRGIAACDLPTPIRPNIFVRSAPVRSPRLDTKADTQMRPQPGQTQYSCQFSKNLDEVRRSKRNKNAAVCYNEEKIIVSNALNNKRSCLDSLNGLSSPGIFKIRTGPNYQVTDIPEYLGNINNCESKDKYFAECREEAIWVPSSTSLDANDVHEFCSIAQKHQGLSMDDALKILMDNDYSILSSLARIEEYWPSRPIAKWTDEEADVFDECIISRSIKQFRRVVKQLSNSKTFADAVEYYYRVKKMRCFTAPHKICPYRSNLVPSASVSPALPRNKCYNCVNSLYLTKSGKILRRRYDVCLACGFYMRLTNQHRPFTIKVCKEEFGNSGGPSTSANGGPSVQQLFTSQSPLKLYTSNTLPEKEKCHPACYFKPRISELNNSREWRNDETLRCVKAIRKHGLDWQAVSNELSKRSIFEVAQFYNENRQQYRLDSIVASSRGGKTVDEMPSQISADVNGYSKAHYSQSGRLLRTGSASTLK